MASPSHPCPDIRDRPDTDRPATRDRLGLPPRRGRPSPLATTTAVAVVVAGVLAGCAAPSTPAEPPPAPRPLPSDATGAAVEPEPAAALRLALGLDPVVEDGQLVLTEHLVMAAEDDSSATEVVSARGGTITVTSGPTGGPALRFPRFSRSEQPPSAAITVVGGTSDWMDPEDRAFRFGADVRLDARSWGSEHDNGDNLVQRGLHEDRSQFKLQVDRRRPSCSIKGDDGRAYVAAERRLRSGVWYRVECARGDDELLIAVARIGRDGSIRGLREKSVTGTVGSMSFPSHTPLAVGGKVSGPTSMLRDADQFNGAISGVFVTPWR